MTPPAQADLLDAAVRAERGGAFPAAAGHLRAAAGGPDAALAVDAAVRLGHLLTRQTRADLAEAAAVLNGALARAEAEGFPRAAAQARLLLALVDRLRGDPAAALARLDAFNLFAGLAGPTGAEGARWCHYRALCLADRADLTNAERFLFRALQLYDEANRPDGLAEVCDSLANLLVRRGKPRPGLAFAERGLAAKRAAGDLYGEALTLGTIGRIRLLQGDYRAAADAFRTDADLAGRLGDDRGRAAALNGLGNAVRLAGDPAAAAAHHAASLAADPGPTNTGYARVGLARSFLAAGRPADAAAELDRLDQLFAAHPDLPLLPDQAAGVRGALAAAAGDAAGAERLLTAGVAGLRRQRADLGCVPLLFDLRDLYHATGRTADAVRVMADAVDVLHRCGSERGVDEVERWLRTVDSPALTRLALGRYLPVQLLDDLLAGKLTDPPPRRMPVTLLFCDLRGFAAMSAGMEPEAVVDVLNDWFDEATRVVRAHGGLVDKFVGDAVMAVFGADGAAGAAAGAVRAAVGLRDELAALNLRNHYLKRPELRIGVGVHTGDAVVGVMGSYLQRSFTAIGATVNTASRVEAATKDLGCDILITAAARDAAGGVAETTYRDRLELKGVPEVVEVYEVRGLREGSR